MVHSTRPEGSEGVKVISYNFNTKPFKNL